MKTGILYWTALAAAAAVAVTVSPANAQTVYGVESGTTSISLHKAVLDSIGYTVTGTSGTTTAAAGYAAGFSIDTTTTAEQMFRFTAAPDFTPGTGIIEHVGTFELNDAIHLGNFVLEFDAGRMSEATTGFFVTDAADLEGQVLFDVGIPFSNSFDGTEWHLIDSDLFIAPEFATFLGDAGLSGQDIGDLRLDALASAKKKDAVPEPSSALLFVMGGATLILRRRR